MIALCRNALSVYAPEGLVPADCMKVKDVYPGHKLLRHMNGTLASGGLSEGHVSRLAQSGGLHSCHPAGTACAR